MLTKGQTFQRQEYDSTLYVPQYIPLEVEKGLADEGCGLDLPDTVFDR